MAKEYIIKDFLKRIKRPIELQNQVEYKLVTIKMNHNGVVLRENKKGAEIKSNMFLVKTGDFILSGIDARNGAFGIIPEELDNAIVTNDFWYFEIDEEIISKELFLELTATSWFDEICKKGSDGTTQRIRLQKDKFFNQTVLLPEKDEQLETLSKIKAFKKKLELLNVETEIQNKSLSQLRQSILQEAIQGKLTEQWRKKNKKVEPASELLKRIKTEQKKTVKRVKKTALPEIKEEEIPFELPENWAWCRLGKIGAITRGKSPKYSEKGIPKMINQKCVRWFDLETIHCKLIDENWFESVPDELRVKEGDVLVNSTGEGTIGRSALVKSDANGFLFDSHVLRISTIVSNFYIAIFINSSFGQNLIEQSKGAQSTKQTELGVNNLSNFIFPLPPFLEQLAIVERVENLLAKCADLQTEIENINTHSKTLLKALFNETFAAHR